MSYNLNNIVTLGQVKTALEYIKELIDAMKPAPEPIYAVISYYSDNNCVSSIESLGLLSGVVYGLKIVNNNGYQIGTTNTGYYTTAANPSAHITGNSLIMVTADSSDPCYTYSLGFKVTDVSASSVTFKVKGYQLKADLTVKAIDMEQTVTASSNAVAMEQVDGSVSFYPLSTSEIAKFNVGDTVVLNFSNRETNTSSAGLQLGIVSNISDTSIKTAGGLTTAVYTCAFLKRLLDTANSDINLYFVEIDRNTGELVSSVVTLHLGSSPSQTFFVVSNPATVTPSEGLEGFDTGSGFLGYIK